MDLLDHGVAEQADVAALGPADGDGLLREDLFAPRPKAGLDLQPRLLEDDLGESDEQADAHA